MEEKGSKKRKGPDEKQSRFLVTVVEAPAKKILYGNTSVGSLSDQSLGKQASEYKAFATLESEQVEAFIRVRVALLSCMRWHPARNMS